MWFHGRFANETEALNDLRKMFADMDESRPPEKRCQLAKFEASELTDISAGCKLLTVGEAEFVFGGVQDAVEVYGGWPNMIANTKEEAREWIEEFEATVAHQQWYIVPR